MKGEKAKKIKNYFEMAFDREHYQLIIEGESSNECGHLCYVLPLKFGRAVIGMTTNAGFCWQYEPVAKWAVFMTPAVPIVQALLVVDMVAT